MPRETGVILFRVLQEGKCRFILHYQNNLKYKFHICLIFKPLFTWYGFCLYYSYKAKVAV